MYHNMDDLIEVCVGHMANEQFTGEQDGANPELVIYKKR